MSLKMSVLAGIPLAISLPYAVSAATLQPFLWTDQTEDAVYLSQDANSDGDTGDDGETVVFFGAGNLSGFDSPAGNIFTLDQDRTGAVFVGDGDTDTVYRLRDNNFDGDAQDASEASIWFSAENADGFDLNTPNGVAVGNDDAVYVVEADTGGNPSGDFVYRTEDLNGDGDANDAGEASVWLDLQMLNPAASAFEIRFEGDVAFIADTVGGEPNAIYRAEDIDGDGEISATEVGTFIDETNPFGVPVDFAIDTLDGSALLWEFLDFAGPQSVFSLTDLDGSGMIDGAGEVAELWNNSLLDLEFATFVGFGVAAAENGDLVLTSNGFGNEDTLIYLTDLNGDGDYFDDGETLVPLAGPRDGLPVRARNAQFYIAPIPLPAGLPLLAGGLVLLGPMRARRAKL